MAAARRAARRPSAVARRRAVRRAAPRLLFSSLGSFRLPLREDGGPSLVAEVLALGEGGRAGAEGREIVAALAIVCVAS